ncbi:xylulokinase [Shouchella patagoniensis]|uniref:xylulokinase n=1 Tax=Shouchella patagoniensis TaxID=228576 RepID=UPI0009959A66|nr:FGGY family carbohydrate kinase [Shouchella patagoniensis]
MENIAAFDIGTTNIKGVLIEKDGSYRLPLTHSLRTIFGEGGTVEQDPNEWWEKLCSITVNWWGNGVEPDSIKAIVMSGQMQDFIPIDHTGNPVRPAILYSDGRAKAQAEFIDKTLPFIQEKTGNHFDGTMVLPKICWLVEHEQATYEKTAAFLVNAKDFAIYKLTGQAVADPVTGATTGMMDLHKKEWLFEWFEQLGLDESKLPTLLSPNSVAGEVLHGAGGFATGTPVLSGSGDAGATSMGAGVLNTGSKYAYIGSTGWVAYATESVSQAEKGVFHLVHFSEESYLAIAPILNAGNVHRWAVEQFMNGNYSAFEQAVNETKASETTPLFLPYLNGERFPVQDMNASGSFMNLKGTTTKEDLCRSVLEGVAFALRQTMELLLGEANDEVPFTLIGGGTKSEAWCQIIADVCGRAVHVPEDADFIPSLGVAAAGFCHLNWCANYEDFNTRIIQSIPKKIYNPQERSQEVYCRLYKKFTRLYPLVQSWTNDSGG